MERYFRSNYSIATTCFDYKTLLDTNAHYYNVTVCISSHNKFIFYSLFFKKGRIKLSNIVKYELSQKMFCCCTVQYLLIIKIDLLLVSRLSFIDCRITSFVLMIDQMNVYLVYIGLFQNILIREKGQHIKCLHTITSRKMEENIFKVWNIALHWSNFSCTIIIRYQYSKSCRKINFC